MSPLTRFTDACISFAARRWPADLTDVMAREWRAEVDYAHRDPGSNLLLRIWRPLAFALSLACSPPAETGNHMETGWRARLSGLGSGTQRTAALVGIGMLAGFLPLFLHPRLNQDGPIALSLVGIPAMAAFGLLTARRLPSIPSRSGSLATAAQTAIPLGAGVLVMFLLPHLNASVLQGQLAVGHYVLVGEVGAFLGWIALAFIVVATASRLLRAGRQTAARVTAIAGLLIATDLAAVIDGLPAVLHYHRHVRSAFLWLPITVGIPGYHPSFHGAAGLAADFGRSIDIALLCAAAYLAVITLRQRPEPVRVDVLESASPPPGSVSAPVRRFAVVLAAAGLGIWSYLLATTPARAGSLTTRSHAFDPVTAARVVDGRLLGMLLMVLALAISVAGRGPVAAPTVTAGTVLFLADRMIAAHGPRGPVAAALALLIGAAVVAGAWWAAPRLLGPETTNRTACSALIAVTVIAAFAIPTISPWNMVSGPRTTRSIVLTVILVGCGILLLATAFVAALAGRTERLSPITVAAAGLVAVGLLVAGVAPYRETTVTDHLHRQFLVQPLIAVVLVAAARWRRSRAAATATVGVAAVVAGAATMLLRNPLVIVGDYLGAVTIPNIDPGTWSPLPPILLGIVIALVFARRLAPPETAAASFTTPITLSPATA